MAQQTGSDVLFISLLTSGLLLPEAWTSDRRTVPLRGAGATFPSEVYMTWMAGYRAYRYEYVDVQMKYDARGSGYGVRMIQNDSDELEYAGSDYFLPEEDMLAQPDIRYFPSLAG